MPPIQPQHLSVPGYVYVYNSQKSVATFTMANELVNAHEAEQAAMANMLSEHISQILVASRLYIECAMTDESQRQGLLEESRNLVATALKEINSLAKSLSPVSLKETGLLETINELADDTSKTTGINFKTCWDGFNEELPHEKLKLTLLRITQEYIKNIVSKSTPGNIEIHITQRKSTLRLKILDDGTSLRRSAIKKEYFFQHIHRRGLLHLAQTPVYIPAPHGNTFSIRFPL